MHTSGTNSRKSLSPFMRASSVRIPALAQATSTTPVWTKTKKRTNQTRHNTNAHIQEKSSGKNTYRSRRDRACAISTKRQTSPKSTVCDFFARSANRFATTTPPPSPAATAATEKKKRLICGHCCVSLNVGHIQTQNLRHKSQARNTPTLRKHVEK